MLRKQPVRLSNGSGEKVLVVGDLHLHWWSASVLVDFQKKFLLDYLPRIASESGASFVVFLGDLFHDKGRMDKRLFSLLVDSLHNLSSLPTVLKIYILAGNHDWFMGEPTIRWASTIQKVHAVVEPEEVLISGTRVLLFPWSPNYVDVWKKVLSSSPDIVFSHVDILSVPYHPLNRTPEKGIDVGTTGVRMVVNGHYHSPSEDRVGNTVVVNVGSVFGTTSLEEGQEKSILTLNLPSLLYERIPTGAPDVVVARTRLEYEEMVSKGDRVVLFRPFPAKIEHREKPTTVQNPSQRAILERVEEAVIHLAKENNLNPEFGLRLVRKHYSVGGE